MSTITVLCPKCQAKLKIPDTISAGKKILCPKCQAPIEVPGEEGELPLAQAVTARPGQAPRPKKPAAERDEEEDVLPPRRRRPAEDEEEDDPHPVRREGRQFGSRDDIDEEDYLDRPRRRKSIVRKKAPSNAVLLWSVIGGGTLVLGVVALALILLFQKSQYDTPDHPDDRRPLVDEKGLPLGRLGVLGNQPGDWVANPAALDRLANETQVMGYRLRPPKGYTYQEQPLGKIKAPTWIGPLGANGPTAVLAMVVVDISPREAQMHLEFLLPNFLSGLRNHVAGLNSSPGQLGRINGIDFIRTYFQGTQKGIKVQGVAYLAVHKGKLLALNFVVTDPNYKPILEIGDASILSIKAP